jgi:hypothetical protein
MGLFRTGTLMGPGTLFVCVVISSITWSTWVCIVDLAGTTTMLGTGSAVPFALPPAIGPLQTTLWIINVIVIVVSWLGSIYIGGGRVPEGWVCPCLLFCMCVCRGYASVYLCICGVCVCLSVCLSLRV